MKRFAMSCVACAIFVLFLSVSVTAFSAEPGYGEYFGGASAELVPLRLYNAEPQHVPRPPVRTVVPPAPNPDLPNNGVTWVPPESVSLYPVAEQPLAGPPVAVTVLPQAGQDTQEVSIRVIVTIDGEDHVIEIPTVTVGAIVQALAPAAPVPTPVAPALAPVALTPAPAATPRANRAPAVITPRMPASDGPGIYRVQVGSFARTALAQSSFEQLRSAGFQPAFERFGSMYRVVIPGVRAAEMPEVAQRLGNAGFREAWARREN